MCKAGMAASTRADEKKLGLAELARLPDPGALKLARELCRDEAVRAEAQAACVQIAAALMASHRQEAQAVLRRGRNDFLMKLTQHTLGCGACLRIRHPDGRVMEGLTFDASQAATD